LQKKFFYFFLTYFLICPIYSQDAPVSEIPGGQILEPGQVYSPKDQPSLNTDAQLYMPETFKETTIYPPSREREPIPTKTKTYKKPSIFQAGFQIGAQYGQFETLPYTDIYFSPYMKIDRFLFMFETPLRFDWNSAFITRMWTSKAAIISKIELQMHYDFTNSIVQYFQFNITRTQNIIQGHGRFFYDYNPNLFGPYETFKSLSVKFDMNYIGFNYLLANIAQPDLMSAEFYIRPLAWIKNPKYQYFKDFKLYGVYGIDLDPFQSYSPGLYLFSPNLDSPSLSMIEFGLDFPIVSIKKVFDLMIYGDYSTILANSKSNLKIPGGYGISGGFLMTFIKKLPIRFEISKAFGTWTPRWVNIFYFVDRPYYNNGAFIRPNKILTTTPNLLYYTSSIGFEWIEKGIFFNTEVYGDFSLNNMWLTLSLTIGEELLKKLSLSVYWTIRNINNTGLAYIPQNTILEIRAKYHMLPNMTWGVLWKQSGIVGSTFQEINGVDNPTIATKPFQFLGVDFAFRY